MVQGLVRLILLTALFLLTALSGCALTPTSQQNAQPVSAETELSGSPALSLLQRADQARSQGDLAAAGRYLERAMGVAPDSSWLYQSLARLRLQQGDAHGAEGLALRALRLAPDNNDYRADLWELIATCRARQGNQNGADQARQQAEQLRETHA